MVNQALPATRANRGSHMEGAFGLPARPLQTILRPQRRQPASGSDGVRCQDPAQPGEFVGAHGRAIAVAVGIKRTQPDRFVFTYQGDGDLAAIGTAETVHAANRGENLSVVFINNAVYAMTGGQMAPTTLLGQKTTTTPKGRNPAQEGYPLKVCELLSSLPAVAYLERVALDSASGVKKVKVAIKQAFINQLKGKVNEGSR